LDLIKDGVGAATAGGQLFSFSNSTQQIIYHMNSSAGQAIEVLATSVLFREESKNNSKTL
jgi:hypothetical protein